MLLFFLYSSSSLNFSQPLSVKKGELGFWSLIGSTSNQKSFIHFPTDPKSQKAGLCSRIPLPQNVSQMNISLYVRHGSISLSFTEEICPFWTLSRELEKFSGFFLNFTETEVYLQSSSDAKPRLLNKLCEYPTENLIWTLGLSNTSLSLSYEDTEGSKVECAKQYEIPNIYSKFLTFIALSSDSIGDIILYSVALNREILKTQLITDLDELSRAHITMQLEGGLSDQSFPMPKTRPLAQQFKRLKGVLKESAVGEYHEVLSEIENRLNKTLTLEQIDELIRSFVKNNLHIIEQKIEQRTSRFESLKNEAEELIKETKAELSNLKAQTAGFLYSFRNEALNTFKQIRLLIQNSTTLEQIGKEQSFELKINQIPFYLYLCSFIEMVSFVAFFLHKRQKTKNFKKNE